MSIVSVILSWDANTETNLAGYRLYVGTASRQYSVATNDVGNVTQTTVSNLSAGTSYYFAVTAYNSDGLESDYSNEVNWREGDPAVVVIPKQRLGRWKAATP